MKAGFIVGSLGRSTRMEIILEPEELDSEVH